MHDLKIDQHLATGRDAVASAFATGSSSLFKAFDGVRTEVSTRLKEREAANAAAAASTSSPTPLSISEKDRRASQSTTASSSNSDPLSVNSPSSLPVSHISRLSPVPSSRAPTTSMQAPQLADVKATLGNIGSGIGSFFGSRVASFRGTAGPPPASSTGAGTAGPGATVVGGAKGLRPMSLSGTLGDRTARSGVDRT